MNNVRILKGERGRRQMALIPPHTSIYLATTFLKSSISIKRLNVALDWHQATFSGNEFQVLYCYTKTDCRLSRQVFTYCYWRYRYRQRPEPNSTGLCNHYISLKPKKATEMQSCHTEAETVNKPTNLSKPSTNMSHSQSDLGMLDDSRGKSQHTVRESTLPKLVTSSHLGSSDGTGLRTLLNRMLLLLLPPSFCSI